LRDLALMLPRGQMSGDDVTRMLDLYHALLAKRGVTQRILVAACEAYVMAPTKDGKKFFPDPGQLFAMCRDDAAHRAAKLKAYRRALDIVKSDAQGEAVIPADDLRDRFKKLNEMFRADREVEGQNG